MIRGAKEFDFDQQPRIPAIFDYFISGSTGCAAESHGFYSPSTIHPDPIICVAATV